MSSTTPTSGPRFARRFERRPALDGLRGIAVLAVVLYHVDHTLLPGGFVGVDLFFVLSGYLITTLLVAEHERTGSVSLRSFWARRMRRLWPLAWVAIAAIALASLTGVWGADRQRTLPQELGASFLHLANWYQVDHGGYVQSFAAPSPVRHFWSLAIEEQFYLVWPALLVVVLALGRRHRWVAPAVLATLAAAAVASGFRSADELDRAYLGTDVRLIALVAGAALAWVFRSHPMEGPDRAGAKRVATFAGLVGAAALLVATLTVEADARWLPKGGYTLVAVAAVGVVAAALTSARVSKLLSWAPLVWVGEISFALYLVHWPLLVALGPGRPLGLRLAVAFPLSIGIAYGAHVVVERPIIERRYRWVTLATTSSLLILVTVGALVWSVPSTPTPTEQVADALDPVPDPTTATSSNNPTSIPSATPTSAPAAPIDVLVVGDSMGRGVANGLSTLADPRLRIWDRTVLGCSLGDEQCPDWRPLWAEAVDDIRPDVVLVYAGVVSDLHGIDDRPFLSDEARAVRIAELVDAATLLSADGADLMFVDIAAPRPPNGLFFCDGVATDSECDPRWVDRWNEAVHIAATASGAHVIDAAGWIAARGTTETDRPDGLHLAGSALAEHAAWLAPQIVAAREASA